MSFPVFRLLFRTNFFHKYAIFYMLDVRGTGSSSSQSVFRSPRSSQLPRRLVDSRENAGGITMFTKFTVSLFLLTVLARLQKRLICGLVLSYLSAFTVFYIILPCILWQGQFILGLCQPAMRLCTVDAK